MKNLLKPAALCAAILLTACGGGDDSKDLFSLWTRDGDGARIDLSGGALSTPFQLALFRSNGAQCNCTLTAVGTQNSGTFVINQCFYVAGSAASAPTPACTIHNGTSSYTKTSSVLTINGAAGTVTLR